MKKLITAEKNSVIVYAIIAISFTLSLMTSCNKTIDPKSFTDKQLIYNVVVALNENDLQDWMPKNGIRKLEAGLFSSFDLKYHNKDESFWKTSSLGYNGYLKNLCWIRHDSLIKMPTIQCYTYYVYDNDRAKQVALKGEELNSSTELIIQFYKDCNNLSTIEIEDIEKDTLITKETRQYLEHVYATLTQHFEKIEKESLLYQ